MASLTFNDPDGISRSISLVPPTHFTIKIQSFSLLTKSSIERYQSSYFEAGGYKWNLVIYPNGNKSRNVKEHLSFYLAMAESNSLKTGWEVYAVFRLFVLDQDKDNYMIVQDAPGKERRFHGMKLEWGFDQKIRFFANGKGAGLGTHLSFYLALVDPTTLPSGCKIYAEYTLRILHQSNSANHLYAKATDWFSASSEESGWSRYITLPYFRSPNSGFLVKDACILEAEVTVHGDANAL
ncbi:E3 ubiquitin-protein ligase SIN-like [Trema orientale]|uniref:E3 ubiquitin-protein ligase SIN-like n=1 Tax=Trema orientale TaxID=63057 RepID=A0A2P5BDQ5_TREOI|nr:E3 ubiquitin-protein ligase SIN-like [Trema orientale]